MRPRQLRPAEEIRARNEGLPFDLLLDRHGKFTYTIEPPGSPHFLLVDHTGKVAYEGWLDDRALWRATNSS